MNYTIIDIAVRAGVSKSTVSRVVSGNGYTSPKTREKVLNAIRELQYKPNAVARAMVSQRTFNIGVIIYRKDFPIVSHPIYGKILDAILAAAESLGFSVFVSTDKEMSLRSADYMLEKRVDGLVLISRLSQEAIGYIDSFNVPYLMVNGTAENERVIQLVNDDLKSGMLAADHLYEWGHRRIAVLAGPQNHRSHHLRYEGFCQRMKELGVVIQSEYGYFASTSMFEDGLASFRSMWERSHNDYPTAIFATNDMLALGAIAGIQEKGLRIPHDISIIGSDNIDFAGFSTPPLTTVHTDKERMGQDAVYMLDRLIQRLELSPSRIEYEPRLIVRGTTGPVLQ
ncbi:LacI family transcriptional regulator [Paenibacillus hemerocallicola]|uniref:LacI family transcriptional regulator n=1 Tax=Paenibacillus hemerocallicola TaxID=1172614 RepID=A0A5C4TFG5_9BACL|nr:LacI family DNA-binding transcriptional regulator [Paenibacillus hemerocallicola]TNJ67718.1 LacI family transcriptional regulator [Paenibacillus hemerocallicola]